MGRKKKHEEHENLERWLVSYADFITLLFATFVVLYALSMSDKHDFAALEKSLKDAFSRGNILEGRDSILDKQASILEGNMVSGETNPIMLEYLSQRYEVSSFDEIKKEVDNLNDIGVEVEIVEKGLVLKLDDRALGFAPNSVEITGESKALLHKLGEIINNKFKIHVIRVEGHTDADAPSGTIYPTNWELSGARASSVVNFLIKNNGISPKLLIASGYADTVPLVPNTTAENKSMNRRVELVILRNKYGKIEGKDLKSILQEATKNKGSVRPTSEKPTEPLLPTIAPKMFEGAPSEVYIKESARIEEIDKRNSVQNSIRPSFMRGN
ncbi:chemotaxis protein MotB [Candidatus Gastranaerophilus sp. (ex Termes propinquus)]|nr:chemotaxis protein MotB [Candidatus Gastranaerophilus sp. (ex Termes propinquus)]